MVRNTKENAMYELAENILETLLKDATPETIVHLKYTAGRPASETALQEFEMAQDWKKASNEYVGHFRALRRTKTGALVLTLWVHNRGETGAYRAFNPRLGHLRDIRIENV